MASKEYQYKFPYDIIDADILKNENGEPMIVYVGPNKYVQLKTFQSDAENLYNFESKSGDVWISTFPRSGTTWASELVWLVVNNLNYKSALEKFLFQRVPFFEGHLAFHLNVKFGISHEEFINMPKIDELCQPGYETLNKMTGRRVIKSHFPFSMLPPSIMKNESKVIYVARNPKDVFVSFYYFVKATQIAVGEFEDFWESFQRNEVIYAPYWTHVKEGWDNRHKKNVLFLFYEEMKEDLPKCIQKIADFLEESITENQISKLSEHLKFENFKNNPSVNHTEVLHQMKLFTPDVELVRKGEWSKDQWPKEYNSRLIEKFQKWIEQNATEIGITFPGW